MAIGAFAEFQERSPKRSPNIGRRAARANKARALFVPSAQPIRPRSTKPVKTLPAQKSELERDVISALVNLGYKPRGAAKVVSKAKEQTHGCDEFEKLFKTALQVKI